VRVACTRVPPLARVHKETHVLTDYAGSYVTGFTARETWVVCVGVALRSCAFVYTGPFRNGEYRRAILSESNEGYAPCRY